ncbi:TPA: coniferyl aldehyde dehydrogenase [Shewanella algae]|uniref:coniferyl aldehyde dehydrogenase n=1 Tax=Shewanella algae TaxID=38313 RepID=UPI001C56DD19|nr:coniferyl aldehyde dehydrogenase [Shewanella algae]HDS1196854.1 coniferyl aldehyde dehydrogenase [Shewanella algae]
MSLVNPEPLTVENQQLLQKFTVQRQAFSAAPMPSLGERKAKLKALKQALLKHQQALTDALSRDYGHRSTDDSLISDILPVVTQINYSLRHLKRWMKPSRRHAGLLLAPASVRVEYQPKGVVGIIVPWNFPIMLSLSPLATVIAAGNRAMLKLSEFTPHTNAALRTLLAEVFDGSEVCVIEGEAEIAASFSALPFDHLLFTGSTQVGRHVMRAAADNLTPVTLELGGKSPVLIARDMPMETAVERLIYGKCLNAGQICVAPDYILCPSGKEAEFISAYRRRFQQFYPDFANTPDYGQILNDRQAARLVALLEDATAKGAQVFAADREQPLSKLPSAEQRKWPTLLLTKVSDDMKLMQEEIFGPLLPLVSYQELGRALDYIKARPRPLALYLMSFDKEVQQKVLSQTHSGGVCINETVFHVAADDAPFGGIGPSGMGHYHGQEGFRTFSHARTVLSRGRLNTGKLVHPPYGKGIQKLLLKVFLR